MSLRQIIQLLLALTLCAPLLAGPTPDTLASSEKRVRIAVMGEEDFHPDRAVPSNIRSLPDDLAARIIEHLTNTKRFEVVERTALRRVIREQQFGRGTPITDVDKVIEKTVQALPATSGSTITAAGELADRNERLKEFQNLGTTVGADYLLYAVLEKVRPERTTRPFPFSSSKTLVTDTVDARLRLRLIDVRQGRILGARSLHVTLSESNFAGHASGPDAYKLFDKLGREAARIVLDLVFPPRVVAADPWVINRGSNEGVRPGDHYVLVREGEEIKDSNGVVIGRLRRQVATAVVSQVQPTLAVLSITSGTAAVGDIASRQAQPGRPGAAARDIQMPPRIRNHPITLAVGRISISPRVHPIDFHQAQTGRITNDLMYKLSRIPGFDVMERAELDQPLDEKELIALAKGIPDQTLLRQLQGADYVLYTAIDDFRVRRKTTPIPYTHETQTRYYGIVRATARLMDTHTGKVASAIKIDIDERLNKVRDNEQAVSRLMDRFSTELAQRISDDLLARRLGNLAPVEPQKSPARRPMPKVNRPHF